MLENTIYIRFMKGGKDYTFSKKRNGIPTAVLTVMSYDGV
jgi:hypothetical protein